MLPLLYFLQVARKHGLASIWGVVMAQRVWSRWARHAARRMKRRGPQSSLVVLAIPLRDSVRKGCRVCSVRVGRRRRIGDGPAERSRERRPPHNFAMSFMAASKAHTYSRSKHRAWAILL